MPPATPQGTWTLRGRVVVLDRPFIVAVLNVTPDSFSDGGRFNDPAAAVERATQMLAEGADAIDVGGESTRPQGAIPVSETEERRRVLPVIHGIRARHPAAILSVDTVKSTVASAALDEGADVINDVSGFRLDPRMGEIAAAGGAGVILMHSRGSVTDMGTYAHATYGYDVVAEVANALDAAAGAAVAAGVRREAIVLDPGIGFAKRSEHSLRILAELPRLAALGRPILVGVSRKRFVGEVSRVPDPSARVFGSVGANVASLLRGARLFRVHDVSATRQALDVAWAIHVAGRGAPSWTTE